MRFRRRDPSPTTLTKRDRSRLVRLGLGLLLVLAAIQVAADPATWAWLFPADAPKHGPTLGDVRFDVTLAGDDLRDDEFRAAPPATRPEPRNADALLDPAAFAGVEDDTLTLRPADRVAYYDVLARLRDADAADLRREAETGVSFPAVMVAPGHYRGRLIEIEGRAHRILDVPAGPNDAGLARLCDLWMFTPDSGNNPWHVVAAELPRDLPRGESIEDGVPVRVTGVLFRREGYASNGGLHVAPLVLAKRVERRIVPAVGAGPESIALAPWVLGGVAALAAAASLLTWRAKAADRRFERTTLRRLAPSPPAEAPAVKEPVADPAEFLRRLETAVDERAADPG